jgi:acetyl-CoA acetyltransferase
MEVPMLGRAAARRTPVVVGIGTSDAPKAPHLTDFGHEAQSVQRALADAGLHKSTIDGFFSAGMPGGMNDTITMAEYLGIDHQVIGSAGVGGAVFEFMTQHAVAAIRDGQCDTVLLSYGSALLTKSGRSLGTTSMLKDGEPVAGPQQFEAPFGPGIIPNYAMAARRHMHEFGTTSEQLAEIAVAARAWAAMNPNAMYRKPLTVDDVLASRMIADPLHLLDCCVISDGGAAMIITTAERAADLRKPPVYVLGAAGAQTHWSISEMPDLTTTAAAVCGPRAFAQAGAGPDDMDTVHLYDSFTITVLLLLEDLGFCKKGDGGAFVENGRLAPGGSLPVNTDGGGLSALHSGMRGLFLMVDAVRQLRGEAGDAQVADARLSVACGSGGSLSGMAAVVLGSDAPS